MIAVGAWGGFHGTQPRFDQDRLADEEGRPLDALRLPRSGQKALSGPGTS